MRLFLVFAVGWIFPALGSLALGQTEADLDRAIEGLGSDDWETRYRSAGLLREAGVAAVPRLEAARDHPELAVRSASASLLRGLEARAIRGLQAVLAARFSDRVRAMLDQPGDRFDVDWSDSGRCYRAGTASLSVSCRAPTARPGTLFFGDFGPGTLWESLQSEAIPGETLWIEERGLVLVALEDMLSQPALLDVLLETWTGDDPDLSRDAALLLVLVATGPPGADRLSPASWRAWLDANSGQLEWDGESRRFVRPERSPR